MQNDQESNSVTRILPSDVTFSQATTTEQLTAVWTLNASEWAPPLSVSNHIERERTLSQQPATGKHWRTWLLTLKEHADEIVSSVETFERPIVVKSGEAGVKKEKAYAIASVFTNPKYRKNGMASLMMEKLKEWLDEDGEGYLSVLYSDIGRDFYTKLGWIAHSTSTLVLEINPKRVRSLSDLAMLCEPMEDEDLKQLCSQGVQVLESELQQIPTNDKTHFAFLPTLEQIGWHNAREDLNAKYMLDHLRCARGVRSESGRAWILWHVDDPEGKLKLQRVVLLDKHERERNIRELVALLSFTEMFARSSRALTVLIWNPMEEVAEAARLMVEQCEGVKMKIEEREGSIPSVRLRYGRAQDDLVWESNEYYAWC